MKKGERKKVESGNETRKGINKSERPLRLQTFSVYFAANKTNTISPKANTAAANRPHTQIKANIPPEKLQKRSFYIIRAYLNPQNANTNTIRPFCACIVCRFPHLPNDRPPPLFRPSDTTLSFLDFYI